MQAARLGLDQKDRARIIMRWTLSRDRRSVKALDRSGAVPDGAAAGVLAAPIPPGGSPGSEPRLPSVKAGLRDAGWRVPIVRKLRLSREPGRSRQRGGLAMRKMSGRTRALSLAGMMAVMVLASMARAGNLDPSAPPAPTMKTLNEIPPTWSQILPAADRFEIVLAFGGGVLDKESGLVWQKQPTLPATTYVGARGTCLNTGLAGRYGWRLPRLEELMSLIDPTVSAGQARIPAGHPFILPVSGVYWTSTSLDGNGGVSGVAFAVDPFGVQLVLNVLKSDPTILTWCVRGGWGFNGSES